MPLRNSPTNATGVLDDTMTREYIVVMRRKLNYKVAERLLIYGHSSKKKNSKPKTVSHGGKTVKTIFEKKKTIYKRIKRIKKR
jgi:hypothetical protein